jgi:glyoxylase-like metal-dependent hydrolase (beta-lactamase superfamily II)
MGNNTYVLYDEAAREAALVDPAMRSEPALEWITRRGLTLRYVLNTHGHSDHTFNNAFFVRETGAKLRIGADDEPMLAQLGQSSRYMGAAATPSPAPDGYLEDGEEIAVGGLRIRVVATPGHTPGSMCFVVEDAVLTGDTLFQGSMGRFDFPGGSLRDLAASIKNKLFVLSPETRVLPGHGPLSSIEVEKKSNPFVGESATVDLSQWMK